MPARPGNKPGSRSPLLPQGRPRSSISRTSSSVGCARPPPGGSRSNAEAILSRSRSTAVCGQWLAELHNICLELLACRDQARRIGRRPREQQRRLDVEDAGKRRSRIVLAGVVAEIGFFRRAGVGALVVDARHQHGRGDAGIADLEFRVREQACDVKSADRIADRHDLVAAAAEQVDVLVHPGGCRRDILRARRPGVRGRQPVIHFHPDHSVARGKAHRRILQRVCSGRGIVAGKTFAGDEQEHRTRRGLSSVGAAGGHVEHVQIAVAISQVSRERHLLARFCRVRRRGAGDGADLSTSSPPRTDALGIAISSRKIARCLFHGTMPETGRRHHDAAEQGSTGVRAI